MRHRATSRLIAAGRRPPAGALRHVRDGLSAWAICLICTACAAPGGRDAASGAAPDAPADAPQPAATETPSSAPAAAPALTPALQAQRANWETFRTQIRSSDWMRIDGWYRQFAGAVPAEGADAYRGYVTQSESDDPATRANGYIGMAASNPKAAVSVLIRALGRERDWNNRTVVVWSLRLAAGPPGESRARRVREALWSFIADAPDADYGICLDGAGRPTLFRSPMPLACPEAFKGLVELKGREAMLDGEGWSRVMQRLTRHVDTEPPQLDPRWLETEPRPRESESETFERLMRDLDGGAP